MELLLSIEFSRVEEGSILSPGVETGTTPQGKATEQLRRKHRGFLCPLYNLTPQSRPDTCSFDIHKIQKHPFLLMVSIIILG